MAEGVEETSEAEPNDEEEDGMALMVKGGTAPVQEMGLSFDLVKQGTMICLQARGDKTGHTRVLLAVREDGQIEIFDGVSGLEADGLPTFQDGSSKRVKVNYNGRQLV